MKAKNLNLGDIIETYQQYLYKGSVKKPNNKMGINEKIYVLLKPNGYFKVVPKSELDTQVFNDLNNIKTARIYYVDGETICIANGKKFMKDGMEYTERIEYAEEKMNRYLQKNKENITNIFTKSK